ncbi:MAG: CpaF family protein [Anaerolineales bacterium]|nr:CpaF family protein [Anaerolineales bacterium]
MTPASKSTTDRRGQTVDLIKVKSFLTGALLRGLDTDKPPVDQRRQVAEQSLAQIYAKTGLQLDEAVRAQLFSEVLDEMLGYGPIQPLLDDPDITEIMVNGPSQVYIEKKGKVSKTTVSFENNEHVLRVIERIVAPLGRRIDLDHPAVDARLPDGSRVNAVIPPVAIDGPAITIRKFSAERLTMDQLVKMNSLTEGMAEFLRACVSAQLNIIISGGTGSGKTTLLNILSQFIPEEERIVTIEDAAELQLQQEHVVRLETKLPNPDGSGGMTVRDLVRNALRMRPERIVVGEVRGGEALDMLQAMNTGHDGSLTTLHSNTPRDAIARLETMTLMAGIELPVRVIREQIASAVDLIVQVTRLRDGSRKVTQITELAGMEGDTVVLTDIFKFEQVGISTEGRVLGDLKPTGIRPMFSSRLEQAGFKLRPEIFGVNIAEMLAANRKSGSGRNW